MILYFRSTDLERNRRRHYLLTLERDLWGNLLVVRRWGRIGVAGWQGSQATPVNGPEETDHAIEETLNRRRWHGYDVVAP